MALPVYAEVDLLPDAPDEVELLEDEQGTASGEDTVPPEQNAATPEPEQSAEPEQPAPTETPEPTAEPTPTPEPAATATATPVPTVTPTATPEPTEQPQKMYAARSVDNVQAVSEQEATDGFTVYFVVPDTINGQPVSASDEIRFNVKTGNSDNNEWWHPHSMEWTGWETNGHKIYAVKNCKDIRGEKFLEIQFQLYKGSDWKGEIKLNNNLGSISSYNNRMYVPTDDGKSGEWKDNPILKDYIYYAKKTIKFENRSTAVLTDVKANFYIPGADGNLNPQGNSSESQTVTSGGVASFTIPEKACSYVRFTWSEGDKSNSSKFYNFYNESVSDENKESFLYSDTSNCFIYTGADNVRWGIEKSFPIYYDATFSKMALTGDTGNFSIPRADQSTVYYLLKGDGPESIGGPMSRIKGTDYYVADVPDGYTEIVFSSYPLNSDEFTTKCGDTTGWETIPSGYKEKEQCFYADTNDDAVYSMGQRGGYWAPKGTKRDAETWKKTETGEQTKVVDIAPAAFTEEANTKYVTSTLYDYYTDYELNGKNRDTYDYDGKEGYKDLSHRNWVTFREFDQALSDYYEKVNAQYPLYTGHFQPAGGPEFSQIASTLNLFGYDTNGRRFMAINNSQYNEDPKNNSNEHTYYAYQGLVADKTSTGNADGAPLLNRTETSAVEPHFNKDFLLGENSKKAKLGEVYENVKFPFTKVENLFGNETGVDYWCFDSKDTTLYLKQNSEQNSDSKYFLQKSTEDKKGNSVNVNVSSAPQGHYGYFPFNETAKPGVASTYNYGFGTKLQMDFTLTNDGMVETNKIGKDGKKEKTSIKFFFSGDDDVWVFIDGQLALDVGGAHGKVSGLLEFGEKEEDGKKKNSVTAYVSKVKSGGTSGDDQDKNNVKTVTYNKESIDFYAKGTTLTFDKGQKHTLTMYYMERGMWESNMAVAFNFPDNNELQVQKEVKLDNVNPAFKNCFKNQKIFNFTIQNQATHYGTKVAAKPNPSDTEKVDLTATGNTIKPATEPTESNKGDYIFELATNPEQGSGPDTGQNTEQVLHWYARYMDTQSAAREKRRGILTLGKPINIKDMRFLTFQVYVSQKDGSDLSLNNLYLELLDNQTPTPGQKGSLGTTGINGATYGSVEVKTDQWVTVKLDLHKMKEQGKFNNNVTTIRVGDNYNRNIYFRDFTFTPKAVPSTMTGFTTDQKEIPDYGSAESGHLENAENAQYTSNMDTDTQLVDGDGRFVLEAGETVTFSDQFRRGSYISLKEDLNENLYDTTWTVCENGREVESTSPTSTDYTSVTLEKPRPLNSQSSPADGPDDGRTEKKGTDDDITGNNYTGTKPQGDTIVFRSYKNPDDTSSLTKLKVKYVNTVKTGGLKIEKKAAAGEENTIKGTYTFKVTFNDVGGEGLEEKPIEKIVTINMSEAGDHTKTITGIPVGTRYTIEEVKTDDSRLQSVTVPDGQYAHVIDNTMVEGEIVASKNPNDPNDLEVTAVFTNTKRKLINIEFDKLWKDANDTVLGTTNQPNEIYIQLQRKNSAADAKWEVVDYPTSGSKYVTVRHTDNGWLYPFNNLDQYPVGGSADNNYIYRIVEGTVEKGEFKQAAEDGTITIDGKTYVVTAEATAKSEKDSETGATTTPATATDGTITGGSGKIVLTNKLQNPKFALDIIKKDAEKDENSNDVLLSGVEFKLEKLVETTAEGKTQWVVDKNYPFDNTNKGSITGTTGTDGKITQNPFKNLEPGTYRLTETKAHPGYNLLAQPIVIEFTQDGKCSIDGQIIPVGDKFTQSDNTYTMTLTVLNRKTPELPHTGADAPSLWLLIGMPLAVAGLLIFTFRYNRKGGRRH